MTRNWLPAVVADPSFLTIGSVALAGGVWLGFCATVNYRTEIAAWWRDAPERMWVRRLMDEARLLCTRSPYRHRHARRHAGTDAS